MRGTTLENQIVGPIFGVLLGIALICILASGFSRRTGAISRPNWAVYGLIAGSLAFLEFGLLGNFFIARSARPVIQGQIKQIESTGGRYPGTLLTIESSPSPVTVRIPGVHPQLIQNDLVRVRYLEYDTQMLQLDVLDGKFAGWHDDGSEDRILGYAMAALGLASAWGAWSTAKDNRLALDAYQDAAKNRKPHRFTGRRPPRGQR